MRWRPTRSLLLLAAASCGEPRGDAREPAFGFEEPAEPVEAMVLHRDTVRSDEGHRVATVHLFLPRGTSEAEARATLQHVIDSIADADTLAAAVSAVGFVMETPEAGATEADLVPVIQALWAPLDTVGMTGSRRRARFRTAFTILRPFADPQVQDAP